MLLTLPGADVELADNDSYTALHVACYMRNTLKHPVAGIVGIQI